MRKLYNLAIASYGMLLRLVALAGNSKAGKWVVGRQDWSSLLKNNIDSDSKWVWFHCASLGEFEQGRPLIEAYREKYPTKKILLTFFSPSGYEIRKNYSQADYVCYLPLDTRFNAELFLDIVKPEKIFFIKYEFWFNFLNAAIQRNIPVFLIAAIFRPNHWFFKSYATSFLNTLKKVNHFFVQDESSKMILNNKGIHNVTLTGDTRFDRVLAVATQALPIEGIEEFVSKQPLLVAGSTWPEDEEIILDAFSHCSNEMRLIVVPHETDKAHIDQLKMKLKKKGFSEQVLFYSEISSGFSAEKSILVIDTIGLLSRLYRYADLAYIGGGFGAGIHNSLEAAVYGVPLVWGPNYSKFLEAKSLIALKAARPVDNVKSLHNWIDELKHHPAIKSDAGQAAKSFVYQHRGATALILEQV